MNVGVLHVEVFYGVWDEDDIDRLKQGEDVYAECGECGESFYINDDNYVLNS